MRIIQAGVGLWLFSILFLSGCTDALEVERFNKSASSEGVCYALPQTFVRLNFILTVDEITHRDFGETTTETGNELRVKYPIGITGKLVADEKNKFVIQSNVIQQAVLLSAHLAYCLDDQGILMAVDTGVTDQTVATLKDLGTAAVEFGKLAARGTEERPVDRLQRRIDEIYGEFADMHLDLPATPGSPKSRGIPKTPSSTQPSTQPVTNPLLEELRALREAVQSYGQDHQIQIKSLEIPYTVLLDPAQFTRSAAGVLEYTVTPPRYFETIAVDRIPKFTVQIFDKDVAASFPEGAKGDRFPGIVYRPPCGMLTRVIDARTQTVLGSEILGYPQYSPLMVIRVDVKPFSDKATSITFSNATGGIRTVSQRSSSSGENIAAGVAAAGADANAVEGAGNSSDQAGKGDKTSKKTTAKDKKSTDKKSTDGNTAGKTE